MQVSYHPALPTQDCTWLCVLWIWLNVQKRRFHQAHWQKFTWLLQLAWRPAVVASWASWRWVNLFQASHQNLEQVCIVAYFNWPWFCMWMEVAFKLICIINFTQNYYPWVRGMHSFPSAPYLTMALFLSYQSYFLSQAQSLCSSERSAIPDSLRWLCHPLGQKFFVERNWTVKTAAKESLYCTQRNPGESQQACECIALRLPSKL